MNAPAWQPEPPTVVVAAAHQMRGPLSSVRLRLELLQDRFENAADPAPGRELAGILREVARLSDVLEQVLAWGAVEHAAARAETADALTVAALRADAWSAAARPAARTWRSRGSGRPSSSSAARWSRPSTSCWTTR